MSAYVIAMMSVHDAETYRKYTDRTPPIVKKHGGKFLTRGEEVTTLEGQPFKERLVILEFPSKQHVEAWYADPDYEAAMVFRHASSIMRMLVQEGGANTADPDPKL